MKGKKLHVLQMIGEFTSGGAESVVVNLARTLDTNLVDLTYTARRNGPVSCELPDPSRLVIIPKRNGLDIGHLKRLIQLIKERKIDLIHAHLFGPNLFGFLAAKLTGRKVIQTIHGRNCFSTGKRTISYRMMFPWVDRIVVVSDILKEEFCERVKQRDSKVITIYNGVNVSKFKQAVNREEKLRRLGIPVNAKIIGSVGNIKPVKGFETLIDTVHNIGTQGEKDVALVIAGEIFPNYEFYKGELENRITNYGLRGKVFFLGYRDDVPDILQLFDLYVMSSRSEGLPMSLLEAMAAGKPVIATDVGMNCRVIEREVSGLIVSPDNPQEMTTAVMRILGGRELGRSLGEKAKETIQQKYSDKIMAMNYEKVYREMFNLD